MKTTIELPPSIFEEAKAAARAQRTTLKSLIEEGLRLALDRRQSAVKPFRLRPVTASLGSQQIAHWNDIRELVYQGRGGVSEVAAASPSVSSRQRKRL